MKKNKNKKRKQIPNNSNKHHNPPRTNQKMKNNAKTNNRTNNNNNRNNFNPQQNINPNSNNRNNYNPQQNMNPNGNNYNTQQNTPPNYVNNGNNNNPHPNMAKTVKKNNKPNTKTKKKQKMFTKKFSDLNPKEKELYLKRKQKQIEKQNNKLTYKPKRKPAPKQRPNQRPNKKRKNKNNVKGSFKFKDPYAYDPKKDPYNPYYQNDGVSKGNIRKHKRKHKKNNILYHILFTIITSITLYTLSITVWFEIENISVIGETDISHEEIIATSNVELYENLIKLSKKSLERKIANEYITIDSVKAHKVLPNTLEIEIEMAQPKALLYYDRMYYTLSESNRIIGFDNKNNYQKENLVSFILDDLEGIDLGFYLKDFDEDVLEDVDRLLLAIEENHFNTINYVDLTSISDIRFYASDLYEIKAGGFSEISYKLHCAKSIIDLQLEDDTEKGIIDVSVDNGVYYFRPAVDIRPNITN